jgi:hypothetical protein
MKTVLAPPRHFVLAALLFALPLSLGWADGRPAFEGAPAGPARPKLEARTASSITIGWNDVEGETRYRVVFGAVGTDESLARVKAGVTRFTARNLDADTRYRFRVQACDGQACSPLSPALRTTTLKATITTFAGCPVFPADNPWNQDVSKLPVHPNSADFIRSISESDGKYFLHADFGEDPSYGIPFIDVPANQRKVPIRYTAYGDQSDKGPFPIPLNAPVEGGSDRHVLVVQRGTCMLYELFAAERTERGWAAQSGAKFDLRSNRVRPKYWTSADAAGLPMFPGLAREREVRSGKITHALRFTVAETQRGFIFPARHWASSSTDPDLPPMGLRLRLKKGYDISGFHGQARVILEALKKYGMIVADNGSSWYISGEQGAAWDDDDLNQLKTVPGSAFEAVYTGPITKD